MNELSNLAGGSLGSMVSDTFSLIDKAPESKSDLKLDSVKLCFFDMWHKVEIGEINSRSQYGDMTLRLKDALYWMNESSFEEDYNKWKKRFNYV